MLSVRWVGRMGLKKQGQLLNSLVILKTKPAYFCYLLLARGITRLQLKCSAWKDIKLVKSSNLSQRIWLSVVGSWGEILDGKKVNS